MPARTQSTPVTITPDTSDVWRYTCPEGHTYAQAAQQGADVHPEYQKILDNQTGRELSRDQVEFANDWPL